MPLPPSFQHEWDDFFGGAICSRCGQAQTAANRLASCPGQTRPERTPLPVAEPAPVAAPPAAPVKREMLLLSIPALASIRAGHTDVAALLTGEGVFRTVGDVLFRAARVRGTRLYDRIYAAVQPHVRDANAAVAAAKVLTPIGLALGEVDVGRKDGAG